ncbi:MAG: protein phosphatase 2C domain-containing protein [Sandaracinaceae bacterium]|nr:protein phosphatase 2C domain-containing protein [Sandaracinaceae bacterium]MDW8246781.1 protein phosphatase 2C domain-containing protein [Sandaracinaceae bacterium]
MRKKELRWEAHGGTDIGQRRSSNQDAFGMDLKIGAFAVADGMGGHLGGEIASHEAIEAALGMLKREEEVLQRFKLQGGEESLHRVRRLVEAAIQSATYWVHALGEADPSYQGMGTTLSLLVIAGSTGFIGQVGDSRVYRFRNGTIQRLTRDHTLAALEVERGLIPPEQEEHSPHRHIITRAVGPNDHVQVDVFVFEVEAGDRYLLCSDGLYRMVPEEELSRSLTLPPKEAVEWLIAQANARGGRDNITALVVDIKASEGANMDRGAL